MSARRPDVLSLLRASDPARAAALDRVSDDAFAPLRQPPALVAAPRGAARARRRWSVPTVTAAVAGVVVLSAAAAYVGFSGMSRAYGGINCVQNWQDPDVDRVDGPARTGDPVADCQFYRAQAGLPPMVDPVAFTVDQATFVTPSDGVPDGATLLAPAPAVRELTASLGDRVDGLQSRCFDVGDATAFASAELARLGLPGWTVTLGEARGDGEPTRPCAEARIDYGDQVVEILPDVRTDPALEGVQALADEIRAQAVDPCLDLPAATAVVERLTAGRVVEPLVTIIDQAADCTRVDLEVGGMTIITLRGPEAG